MCPADVTVHLRQAIQSVKFFARFSQPKEIKGTRPFEPSDEMKDKAGWHSLLLILCVTIS